MTGPQDSYPPQLTQLFGVRSPSLVTLTVGGNDVNWLGAIRTCYQVRCNATTLPASLMEAETALTANLRGVLDQIASHYGNRGPRVVVTGYYQPFSAAAHACPDMKGATPSLLAASATAVQTSLNSAIQAAVQSYGSARFAPVSFAGHELCTSSPWVQGIAGRAPLHPTAAGQAAYAAAVEAAAKS